MTILLKKTKTLLTMWGIVKRMLANEVNVYEECHESIFLTEGYILKLALSGLSNMKCFVKKQL